MAKLDWNRPSKINEKPEPYPKACFKKKKGYLKPQSEAQRKRVEAYLEKESLITEAA